jgi:hypothetical protein
VEKYFTAIEATDNNMEHALCFLGTKGYKHAFRIRNNYRFFHSDNGCKIFNVGLNEHCLSF